MWARTLGRVASAPDLPPPLGAFVDDDGCTFAIMAAHATGVELCLFGDHETDGPQRIVPMTDRIHGVWFVHVPGVQAGQRYGYRVHGPWRPDQGQRHNPAKLLVDPYARAIEGDVAWVPQVYGLSALVSTQAGQGEPLLRAVLARVFGPLQGHRIGFDVTVDNARALRLYERLGFQREGHIRECWKRPGGDWVDCYLMGLLAREWQG